MQIGVSDPATTIPLKLSEFAAPGSLSLSLSEEHRSEVPDKCPPPMGYDHLWQLVHFPQDVSVEPRAQLDPT